MVQGDPHIHVEAHGAGAGAAVRSTLASTFGLVGDLPAEVTAGCGQRVPYAMTAARPEAVTCLACRDHARAQHLRLADQLSGMAEMPGIGFSEGDAVKAAGLHRDLAKRFSS
ncbi:MULTISPECIES: hypothetical protein [Actinoplanes]|uniref:hypothetical protein n=1 Tax=Actinoplanes TaxID=1865 RepID=UPI0005F2C474|nr:MULTISPECIES: hypothetical protein [Actinoplanes]